jgi:hypothetical protein
VSPRQFLWVAGGLLVVLLAMVTIEHANTCLQHPEAGCWRGPALELKSGGYWRFLRR